jgi:DNA-binding CsgD family transcriptional regulator
LPVPALGGGLLKCWDDLEKVTKEMQEIALRFQELKERQVALQLECLKALRKFPEHLLSRRETEVLIYLQSHPRVTNKDIALQFGFSERTAKFHISALLLKFGAKSRNELAFPAVLEELK